MPATMQDRIFSWTGSGFQQTGGPTTFLGDHSVSDLQITAPAAVVTGTAPNLTGTLTITVTNNGPATASNVRLALGADLVTLTAARQDGGGDWPCFVLSRQCQTGSLGPGQSVTYTLPVRVGARVDGPAVLFAGPYRYATAMIVIRPE